MKKLLIGIGFAILLIIVAIYLRPPMEKRTSDVIKIGVLKHESSLPIYIADELGLFAKAGLSVKIIELPPGDHMPALLSKRVDILSPTSFPVLFGIMQKNPGLLYAVFPGAEVANGPTVYGFIVSKESRASTIADLKKKTVMAINPYTKMNIQTILSSSGMPHNEWPVINVAAREPALQAVSNGQAAAAIMDQPALAVAIASGDFKLLEANPRAKHIGSPYWSGSGAVLKQHWKDNAATFTRLIKAIDDALVYIKRDPDEAHRILAKRLSLHQSIAKQMGGYYFPKSTEAVDLNGIDATVKALVKSGLLEEQVKMEGLFPPGTYGVQ